MILHRWDRYRWYQAGGDMEKGDYVICKEDPTVLKWNGKNGIPIGKVIGTSYTTKYSWGDRVLIDEIWDGGYLLETLKIGNQMFYIGNRLDYVKRKVDGKSDEEIFEIYDKKHAIDEVIYKLKKVRDKL